MSMEKTKVLFIYSQLGVGGAETLLTDMLRGLDRSRFQPMLCYFHKGVNSLEDEVKALGAPMYFVDLGALSVPVFFWRLAGVIRRARPDVINTWGDTSNLVGRAAALLAGHRRTVSLDVHEGSLLSRPLLFLERLMCRLDAGRIAISRAVAETFSAQIRLPLDRIDVVHCGIDAEHFSPRPPNRRVRAELGIPPDCAVVTIVARLTRDKNHRMYVRAAARVCAHRPNTVFLVVGSDFWDEYGVKDAQGNPVRNVDVLRQMAAELGVGDKIKYLGLRRDVPEILSITDVFAMTSVTEGLNNSVLEAMASGLPVVATAVGGMKESILHAASGYYVKSDDDAAMAERIIELLDDPAKRRAFGQAGRQRVLDEFTVPIMVRRKEAIYARAAQSRFSWLRLLRTGFAHPPAPAPSTAPPER